MKFNRFSNCLFHKHIRSLFFRILHVLVQKIMFIKEQSLIVGNELFQTMNGINYSVRIIYNQGCICYKVVLKETVIVFFWNFNLNLEIKSCFHM